MNWKRGYGVNIIQYFGTINILSWWQLDISFQKCNIFSIIWNKIKILQNSQFIVYAAVNQDIQSLNYVDHQFKQDTVFMSSVINRDIIAAKYMDSSLIYNPYIVCRVLCSRSSSIFSNLYSPQYIIHIIIIKNRKYLHILYITKYIKFI